MAHINTTAHLIINVDLLDGGWHQDLRVTLLAASGSQV